MCYIALVWKVHSAICDVLGLVCGVARMEPDPLVGAAVVNQHVMEEEEMKTSRLLVLAGVLLVTGLLLPGASAPLDVSMTDGLFGGDDCCAVVVACACHCDSSAQGEFNCSGPGGKKICLDKGTVQSLCGSAGYQCGTVTDFPIGSNCNPAVGTPSTVICTEVGDTTSIACPGTLTHTCTCASI